MKYFALITLLILSACAAGPKDAQTYLESKNVYEFTDHKNFQHCRAYGCREIDTLTLPPKEWKDIAKVFKPTSKNAKLERERIAKAIGIFETKIGAINGTDQDIFGTFKKVGTKQHDCVDESVNTTIYLSLLEQDGLLKFHDIGGPDTRIPLIHYSGVWPHQTAVIFEKDTKDAYAVDSWFHNNGFPAEIVPLQAWKGGWKPAEHKK
ncbi:MAG: hypothetical protein DHS20C02_08660 [Micavibrio sp.]|nr:MAG: hypothetical protein DHS20C02_08660 [Micavibrio sp.]